MTSQPSHLRAIVPVDRDDVRKRELDLVDGVGAPTDAELLRASRGDPDAFRMLYSRYSKSLFRHFTRRTGSEGTALERAPRPSPGSG
jgi:hypothetical protein